MTPARRISLQAGRHGPASFRWNHEARDRRLVLAAVVAALLVLGVYGALFTDLGILAVGHHYWMSRAALSPDDASLTRNLERVFNSAQYGVNSAENWVLDVGDRETQGSPVGEV